MSNDDEEILDNLFNNHLISINKLNRDKGIELIKKLLNLDCEKYGKLFKDKILTLIIIHNNEQKWTFRFFCHHHFLTLLIN